MLAETGPDVVHITTPPQSHYILAARCLEAGAHVYVEKPFTVSFGEAQRLLQRADETRRKVTVGHDLQFSHAARHMRRLVEDGYLGGAAVHMESYYCYDLGSQQYARALLGDSRHWVRSLPGKLLQNIISHGIAPIAEFLCGGSPRVAAFGFTSPFLISINEGGIVDELRVIINEDNERTAYFTFSSQMKPALHSFTVYGPKNGIAIDFDHQTLLKLPGLRHKSYLDKFVPPLMFAKQFLSNEVSNIRHFTRRDFHMKGGMRHLMRAFYDAIRLDEAVPISYREILTTSKIMEDVFGGLHGCEAVLAGQKETERDGCR